MPRGVDKISERLLYDIGSGKMAGISGISLKSYSSYSDSRISDTIKQLQDQIKQMQQQYKTISGSNQSSAEKQEKLNDLNTRIQQLEMRIQQMQQSENDKKQDSGNSSKIQGAAGSQNGTQTINGGTMTGLIRAGLSYKTATHIQNTCNSLKGRSNELESDAELDMGKSPQLAAKEHSEAVTLQFRAQDAEVSAQSELHGAVSQARDAEALAGKSSEEKSDTIQSSSSAQTDNGTAAMSAVKNDRANKKDDDSAAATSLAGSQVYPYRLDVRA